MRIKLQLLIAVVASVAATALAMTALTLGSDSPGASGTRTAGAAGQGDGPSVVCVKDGQQSTDCPAPPAGAVPTGAVVCMTGGPGAPGDGKVTQAFRAKPGSQPPSSRR